MSHTEDADKLLPMPTDRKHLRDWRKDVEQQLRLRGDTAAIALPDHNPEHLIASGDASDKARAKAMLKEYAALTTYPVYIGAGEKKKIDHHAPERNRRNIEADRKAFIFLEKCAKAGGDAEYIISDPCNKES